jgi:hypothetical protein
MGLPVISKVKNVRQLRARLFDSTQIGQKSRRHTLEEVVKIAIASSNA